jgi:hypothetical protein
MNEALKSRRFTEFLYYLSAAILPVLALGIFIDTSMVDFSIPMNFFGDTLPTAMRLEAFLDGDFMHSARLGAPFTFHLYMYPILNHFDFGLAALVASFTKDFSLALLFGWLFQLMLTGLVATWCFRRLDVSPPVALVSGILFALIPYALAKNIVHYVSSTYQVALLVTFCILILQGRYSNLTRWQKRVFFLCPVLVGFNEIYTAFFSCFILAISIGLALSTREKALVKPLALMLLLITAAAVTNAMPSYLTGQNTEIANADFDELRSELSGVNRFGVKLRELLLPVANNYVPVLFEYHENARENFFYIDEHNHFALGLFGSIGLLAIFGMGLLSVIRPAQSGSIRTRAGPAIFIVLSCLLLGMVGGFSNFFALHFHEHIPLRSYFRISIFIAFCSFFVSALLLDKGIERVNRAQFITNSVAAYGLLAIIAMLGIQDQINVRDWNMDWMRSKWLYDEVQPFVAEIEESLPANAMVYQFPDRSTLVGDDFTYSFFPHLYGYLLSDDIRWSYSHLARNMEAHRWHVDFQQYSPRDMANFLLVAGFSGVWFDTFDIRVNDRFIYYFSKVPYTKKIVSSNGRFVFVDFTESIEQLKLVMGKQKYKESQIAILKDPTYYPTVHDSMRLR